MDDAESESHGLIVRAWFEPAEVAHPMRVRILELRGPSARGETLAVVASGREACDVVCTWLEELATTQRGSARGS